MLLISDDVLEQLVDNTDSSAYYSVALLLRKKDFPDGKLPDFLQRNGREYLVQTWVVQNCAELKKLMPRLIKYADLFNGRVYLGVDRMSLKATCTSMMHAMTDLLVQLGDGGQNINVLYKMMHLQSSLTRKPENVVSRYRRWLLDFDDVQDQERIKEFLIAKSQEVSADVRNSFIFTREFLDTQVIFNPSVTGCHVIGYIRTPDYTVNTTSLGLIWGAAKRDPNLGFSVDVKFNASTLLYKA